MNWQTGETAQYHWRNETARVKILKPQGESYSVKVEEVIENDDIFTPPRKGSTIQVAAGLLKKIEDC